MPWRPSPSQVAVVLASLGATGVFSSCVEDPLVLVPSQSSDEDADSGGCVTGDEDCECYPNSTCNRSLVCVDERCETDEGPGSEPEGPGTDQETDDDDGRAPSDDDPVDDDVSADDDNSTPADNVPAPDADDEAPDDISFGEAPTVDDDVVVPLDDDISPTDDDSASPPLDDDVAPSDDDVTEPLPDDDVTEPLPDDDISGDDDGTSVPAGCGAEFEVTSDGFVRAPGDGDVCWYGYAWSGSSGGASITPEDFSECGTPCQLCASGSVPATDDYAGGAWIGFNIRQDAGGALPLTTSLTGYITVDFTNSGGSPLRAMIQGPSGSWCSDISYNDGTAAILADDFNTQCWDGGYGTDYGMEPIESFLVFVPGNALEDVPYDFCVTRVEN
jgi:hypothetical protein